MNGAGPAVPSGADRDGAQFKWDRKTRLSFASLLIVQLPADFTFPPNAQKIEGWRIRREPALHAKAVGMLTVGMRFRVLDRNGFWLKLKIPDSSRTGWALAEIDGIKYIRPIIPPVAYPWQRGRGLGLMYEDLLCKRRNEMRQLDLASSQALRFEWNTLVSELDVVLRLSRGFEGIVKRAETRTATGGNYALTASVRRPRSNSFFAPRKAPLNLPSEGAGGGDGARRPRANTFVAGNIHGDQMDESQQKDQWEEWKSESKSRQAMQPFDAAPLPAATHRTGEELLRETENMMARAREVAQQRLDNTAKYSKNMNRLLTSQRLREHEKKTLLAKERDDRYRPRTNSMSGMPVGLSVPAPEPDVSSLYKWSWEKQRPLDPRDFAVDPMLPDAEARARRLQQRGHVDGDIDPSDSPPTVRAREREKKAKSPSSGQKKRRNRARSLPCRKADGARHKLFIPALD